MSLTTPPGWYPDPVGPADGLAAERYWDGTAWTGHTRTAAPGAARAATLPDAGAWPHAPGSPASPYAPAPAPPPRLSGGRRRALVAGLVAVAVLLAAVMAGGLILLAGDGDRDARDRAGSGPTDAAAESGPDGQAPREREDPEDPGDGMPTPGESGPAGREPLTAARAGGVALPVPGGWRESALPGGVAVLAGSYPCPAQPALDCVNGSAFLTVIPGLGSVPPEEYARGDLAANEAESYDATAYGSLTGRRQILAETVTVAGRPGYRVRSRVETGSGVAAFVESVAFPAPDGSGDLMLLRLGLDEGSGPTTADLDRIVAGAGAVSAGPGTEV
ncbi:DUF2510 domain-containing protein [Streptomyces sp. DSM 44917]|uniref:DUF2510 domain-containing protein n=1 Tax=Streptomyces boetiae TaxID=3075541 RepID=A0ABU2L412_9ACTN|nr:DUF2510 domain-containing protein [Streptomyces sp. DSM 44917]MDT0305978.1 DUF2510 domain-containing protein [Streptomyces sp. DSM 44917]